MAKEYNYGKIPYYLKRIMGLLPQRRKKQFLILLGSMIAVAVLETATLGLLSVFATSISSPDEVLSSGAYKTAVDVLGIRQTISSETLILILSIAVVLAVIVKNAATGVVRYWVARFGAVVQGQIGRTILERFLKVDYEWHLTQNPHDLLITLNWRVNVGLFISSSMSVVSNLILVLIMMGGIVVIQPVLMPFMIVILGLASIYIYKIVRRRIDTTAKEVYRYTQESNLDGAKTIHGMKDVRIFGLERDFLEDYSDKVFKLSRYLGEQQVIATVPTWIMEAVGFFFLSAAIVVMLFVMKLSRVEIFGTLALLAVAAWRVLPATNRIISGIGTLRSNYPYIDRIYEVLDDIEASTTRTVGFGAIRTGKDLEESRIALFEESFTFDSVSFRYGTSENFALKDVSCRIDKGASIGIIGHSGAGKSTFVDLFIGLLKPTEGRLLIDGVHADDEQLDRWKRGIGYVPQFPYIYDCSLAENVAFGDPPEQLDEKRIRSVCAKASIDFLDDLELGIHSRIGERGLMISGGQKQRVAIARALYHEPEILVFDEATSSLDTKSEASIKATIDSFKGQQTMLIIAHRLTTVENCDYLIWLEKGILMGIGSPEEILPEYNRHLDSAD